MHGANMKNVLYVYQQAVQDCAYTEECVALYLFGVLDLFRSPKCHLKGNNTMLGKEITRVCNVLSK